MSSGHCDNPSFVGSAWRDYSARHAALWSGSNEPRVYDGLGSTRQLINHTDQSVTESYEYEAFGNLMSSSGSTPNPYRYVGSLGYYQTGTSLMHLGARYYMPEVGRFLSQDEIGPPASYVYAENSPCAAVDPSGYKSISRVVDCNESPRCDPGKEAGVIRDHIRFVERVLRGGAAFLEEKDEKGEALRVAIAVTECVCRDGTTYAITRCGAGYWRYRSGCVQKCLNEHEQTHRYQCVKRGPERLGKLINSGNWFGNTEKAAYQRELKCLRRLRGG
ncbi:MAG: RHS repeat-associated core domain-containing protein [Armatimonadota bacterium]|nr:MAG: RHS repeat-associated core domain-containing protein [Armatimonadota bacterium]